MGSYSEQPGEGASCMGDSMGVPAALEKQDTLKIPFDAVLHEDHHTRYLQGDLSYWLHQVSRGLIVRKLSDSEICQTIFV